MAAQAHADVMVCAGGTEAVVRSRLQAPATALLPYDSLMRLVARLQPPSPPPPPVLLGQCAVAAGAAAAASSGMAAAAVAAAAGAGAPIRERDDVLPYGLVAWASADRFADAKQPAPVAAEAARARDDADTKRTPQQRPQPQQPPVHAVDLHDAFRWMDGGGHLQSLSMLCGPLRGGVNTTVHTLSLTKTRTGAAGVRLLVDALCSNTTVTRLDVSNNPHWGQHAPGPALARLLRANATLTALDCSHVALPHATGLVPLLQALVPGADAAADARHGVNRTLVRLRVDDSQHHVREPPEPHWSHPQPIDAAAAAAAAAAALARGVGRAMRALDVLHALTQVLEAGHPALTHLRLQRAVGAPHTFHRIDDTVQRRQQQVGARLARALCRADGTALCELDVRGCVRHVPPLPHALTALLQSRANPTLWSLPLDRTDGVDVDALVSAAAATPWDEGDRAGGSGGPALLPPLNPHITWVGHDWLFVGGAYRGGALRGVRSRVWWWTNANAARTTRLARAWARIAVVVTCVRANAHSPYRDSVLALVPMICAFANHQRHPQQQQAGGWTATAQRPRHEWPR